MNRDHQNARMLGTDPFTITNYITNLFSGYFMWITNVVHADGTIDTYQYSAGQTIITSRGNQTTSSYDDYGNLAGTTVVDVVSDIQTGGQNYYVDDLNRPIKTSFMDGSYFSTTYSCCGPESTTERDGTETTYTYDALNRQITSTRNGLTMSNIFDTMGHVVQTVRIGTNGSTITLNSSTYDTAGRLSISTDAMGNNTTNTYAIDANSNSVQTIYYPDGSTQIQTQYPDGSIYAITGTAVNQVEYAYGADTNGAYTTETKLDASGEPTSEWTKTYTSMTGQTYLTLYPDSSFTESYYNSLGQLWKQVDQDGIPTLYLYDTNGIRNYTIIDTYGDGQPHLNGTNRVNQVVRDVLYDSNVEINVVRLRAYAWQTNGVNSPTLVSQTETSTDGLTTWNITDNGTTYAYTTQTYGGSEVSTVTSGVNYYYGSGSSGWSTSETVYTSGLLTSALDYTPGLGYPFETDYGYDAHGRQYTITDANMHTTTTNLYNNADQIVSVTTPSPDGVQPGLTTSNIYDNMGRVSRTILPDGTSVTNQYYTTGALYMTSGSRTYPVQYGYDYAGRVQTMTTWQDFESSSGAAVTTWNYDTNRSWLVSKQYNDGNGPSYTYTPAGRLKTRTWARGVTTTNNYSNTGDLSSVSYSDGTSSVAMAYNRQGQKSAITQGSMTTSFAWDGSGNLTNEAYSGGPLNGLSVTNGYDVTLNSRTNLTLLNASSAVLASTKYNYGTYGSPSRLANITDGTNAAAYTYVANEPLVNYITYTQSGTTRMTTQNTWDHLHRLTGIASTTNSVTMTSFQYAYNTAGQRVAVTNMYGGYWVYQYDALGQVISGTKYWNNGTLVAGQQFNYAFDTIGNRQSTGQGGDSMGVGVRQSYYNANLLNEYTQRTVPGAMDVIGSANSNATITVNNQRAYRDSDYFWEQLALSNDVSPVWEPVTNIAALNNGTNADIVATNIGNVFLPQTPEVYGYDLDGNLANDGRWTYTWDAENRLTNMTSLSSAPAGSKLQLAFSYDYQGRRIQKIVSTNSGTSYVGEYTNNFVYDGWNLIGVLDGSGNLLYSFTWGTDLSGSFPGAGGVGGLISMTVHSGANAGTYFYCYDGNGNVVALLNASTQAVAAKYEYGPFGEVIRATGPMAKLNPFRFSTKFDDDESDLLYYGYRFYNPSTGRWLSRDPMNTLTDVRARYDFLISSGQAGEPAESIAVQPPEEDYVLAGNNTVSIFDLLGLWCEPFTSGPGTLHRVSEIKHKFLHTPANTLTFNVCCPSIFMELTGINLVSSGPREIWSIWGWEPVSSWNIDRNPTSPGCYRVTVEVPWHTIMLNPDRSFQSVRIQGTCCNNCSAPLSLTTH